MIRTSENMQKYHLNCNIGVVKIRQKKVCPKKILRWGAIFLVFFFSLIHLSKEEGLGVGVCLIIVILHVWGDIVYICMINLFVAIYFNHFTCHLLTRNDHKAGWTHLVMMVSVLSVIDCQVFNY